MKRARIINAAWHGVLAISLIVCVCIQWYTQGCGWQSLLAGATMYTAFCAAFGLMIDDYIKDVRK